LITSRSFTSTSFIVFWSLSSCRLYAHQQRAKSQQPSLCML